MWRYTLKYGNWLDMAEIEIGIMSHQALARSLADIDSFKERRSECRIKLAYPTVL